MRRHDYECWNGHTGLTFWESLTHCDPAAFDTDD